MRLSTIICRVLLSVLALGAVASDASAQLRLDADCTVSILNRSTQVRPDGTWRIDNIPVQPGVYRARSTCLEDDGSTVPGQTVFAELVPNGFVDFGRTTLGLVDPVVNAIDIVPSAVTFTQRNERLFLQANGIEPGGTERDVTTLAAGTIWATSDPNVVTVTATGELQARSRGRALVTARNEGVVAGIDIEVLIPNDADGDGMTDGYETANGLNPNDADDAGLDLDGDGLTNLEEFERGLRADIADTDGDGINDGDEVALGLAPDRADTDGDGLVDGDETRLGSNPLLLDTDGDGIGDGAEVSFGLDPITPDPVTDVIGRVRDETDAVVAGAAVTLLNSLTTTTGANGSFRIDNVPAVFGVIFGVASLVDGAAVKDGRSASVSAVVGGVTDLGSIGIVPVIGRVTGTILSPRQAPVPNAGVTIVVDGRLRTVNADALGVYRLDKVAPGEVSVLAVDPATGLRGRTTGTLAENSALVANVVLTAAATAEGSVLTADAFPAGRAIDVTLSGPINLGTQTDFLSDYRFDLLPLGVYSVEASDTDGNRARSQAILTATNQVVSNNLTYLGKGTVEVQVEGATGFPVRDATVTVRSQSLFGGEQSAASDALGQAAFDGVFVGPFEVTASDPANGLGGFAAGQITAAGAVVALTVTLEPAGALSGTVFQADGSTPVAGAMVALSPTGQQVTTDAAGRYTFTDLPLRSYDLTARFPTGVARARASAAVTAAGATTTRDLVLNAVGALTVRVVDFDGAPVPFANVEVFESTFGGRASGTTNLAGERRFENLLAGFNLAVSAQDPETELGAMVSTQVLAGEDAILELPLEAAGVIKGTVLQPDGATPLAGARVRLEPLGRTAVTGTDGRYEFMSVPLARSPFTVLVFDTLGAERARLGPIALLTQGQVAQVDAVISGAGRVEGMVFNPDGSTAAGVGVTLDSAVAGQPTVFATTDLNGAYTFANVPVGNFNVIAQVPVLRFGGNVIDTLQTNGQVVTADIEMLENQVPDNGTGSLTTFYDANGFAFALRRNGEIRDGSVAVFRGNRGVERGGARLELGQGGFFVPFAGTGAAFEDSGREVSVSGSGPDGLSVTRKVFVPRDGYFARYLEILTNPTADPVEVDVRVDTHYRFITEQRDGFTFNEPPRVVEASSGLQAVSGSETWFVIDDNRDVDPFRSTNLPSVAQVVGDGIGAVSTISEFEVNFGGSFGRARSEWQSVTVPAGGTVALMHFVAQQSGRDAAGASAVRLEALPPEALSGLSAAERTAIANFAVPADGVSVIAPLPALNGAVAGLVTEADLATVVPGAQVFVQSVEPVFSRSYRVVTGADGRFALAGDPNGRSNAIVVPLTDFTLDARHPQTGVTAPMVLGSFAPGEGSASADVAFAGTGIVDGVVRRSPTIVASTGTVRITGDGLLNSLTVNIAVDGRFFAGGLPPGIYTLSAQLPDPTGTGLSGTGTTNVTVGATAMPEIFVAPTGAVVGTVRDADGNAVVDTRVTLVRSGFSRRVRTDTGGGYAFLDVPLGSYTVSTIEPRTGIASAVDLTVAADTDTTADLALIGVGGINVAATFVGGGPAAGATVQVRSPLLGDFFRNVGVTDAGGNRTVGNLPVGAFSLRVLNPINNALQQAIDGTIAANGQFVAVPVAVPVDLPPLVALTAPTAGSEFLDGTVVALTADASDDLGVTRVEFELNGQVVGSDSSAPYAISVPVQSPVPGPVAIVARAFDTSGQRTVSPTVTVNVIADVVPPVVTLTAPTDASSLIEGTSLVAAATATDNVGVARVEFRLDGQLVGTDPSAPYGVTAAAFADGQPLPAVVEFEARAFDRAGNAGSAAIMLTLQPDLPPQIALTQAPAAGSEFIEGATVRFSATATDDVGVSQVQLLVDGTVTQTRNAAPYQFDAVMPLVPPEGRDVSVVLRARDTRGQTASTAPVTVRVTQDLPPTATITAPLDNTGFFEGQTVSIAATATDDRGVVGVEFLVDGTSLGVDATEPFEAQFQLPPAPDGTVRQVQAIARDTLGQEGSDAIGIVSNDDVVPPTVSVQAPAPGAVVSVGPSDVAIVIDTSGSTGSSCGLAGTSFDILDCEIEAAFALLDFFNPGLTQVAVVDFSSNAVLVQPLTTDFDQVRTALTQIRNAGPGGGTSFTAGMQVATNELLGPRSRREATPVQLFLSDGSASFPSGEVNRAADAQVVANTFAVGAGASTSVLQQIADGTGGVLTTVVDPAGLIELLPQIVLFGIEAIPVVVDANDDVAVERVELTVSSVSGSFSTRVIDLQTPFASLFDLPIVGDSLDIVVEATAFDFGGNASPTATSNATVLPAENLPEIVRVAPAAGAPGDTVTIVGRYFAPAFGDNLVNFNGVEIVPTAGTKSVLTVTVPTGTTTEDVFVVAGGLTSNAVTFIIDSDLDGLSDALEGILGTNPIVADTDGGGIDDGTEVNVDLTDPLDIADDRFDGDGDGLFTFEELALGTNPDLPDTDFGGVNDGDEVNIFGTNPLDPSDDPVSNEVEVFLGDDDFIEVPFSQGFTFNFYGTEYTSVFINSNGRLTFEFGDTEFNANLVDFLEQPQVAPLFTDLTPSDGGRIVYEQTAETFTVRFEDVPLFGVLGGEGGEGGVFGEANSFQVRLVKALLAPSGEIVLENDNVEIDYGRIETFEAIVGVSSGAVETPPLAVDLTLDSGVPGGPLQAIFEEFSSETGADIEFNLLEFLPLPIDGYIYFNGRGGELE